MRRTWSSAATSRLNQRQQQFFYVLLALIVLNLNVSPVKAEARRPPNYHHDQMPDTTFTCAGKVVGGYYADPDADCQMFHVCVQVDENDVRDFKFMCPTDTVFDQENFICANWFEIDCRSSTLFYDKNLQLFQPDRHHNKGSASATSTTEEPSDQQKRQQEQQLKQLMVLEEQQQAQVLKQQQVLEQHERRQQEHQRNQLKIIQDQQKQLEKQQGRKVPPPGGTTTTTTTTVSPDVLSSESIIYDYYYYDEYENSEEQGHFYINDEFDPNSPGRIIDPTNARPPLLPILPPAKTILDSKQTKQ